MNVEALTNEANKEDIEILTKVEGLMNLAKELSQDRENSIEVLGEILEQRREDCISLGVDVTEIDEAISTLSNAFLNVGKQAHEAQIAAIQSVRKKR